jgi:hypothetical protein
VNIHSLLLGNSNQKTCVILDELDGSDPHAQNKIVDWIRDPLRTVPILCTGNESPSIIKRNPDLIKILRCFPPNFKDVEFLFPDSDIQTLLRECNHDIRRVFHRVQYGLSDAIPKFVLPPTGTEIEKAFIETQNLFGIQNPLEYLYDKLGSEHWTKTKAVYIRDDKRADIPEADTRPPKLYPDKLNKTELKKKTKEPIQN